MIGIDEILKKRFLELIKSVQPTGRWKLVVVDSLSSKILNSACKMYDILEENVTLVENIEKPRQPYPSYEAVYILTPCIESCSRLVDDFSRKDGPMYAAAHVHFINALDNNVFTELTHMLNAANAANHIKSLKEMYVDFIVREHCVYTLDNESRFLTLFGSDGSNTSQIETQLDNIAKELLSVCVTLGESPLIRYHRPLDEKGTINRKIPELLAKLVQAELDNFCATNPEFPPPRDPPLPSGTLILLDRTIDPIAPFLHEFTYQAMMADLLKVEEVPTGLKYEYTYIQEDGTDHKQEVTLNEQDTVYTMIRHMHIASTTEKLIEDFNRFMNENKISSNEGQTTASTLNDMKNMISNLPQFQEMKSKYSAQMTIANDCMAEFKYQNLEAIGLLEQNMACGETPEGDEPKNLKEDLISILDDPETSEMVKTRLILLWIASAETINPEDLEELLSYARLDQDYKDAITNISLLGVQLSKSANKQGQKTKNRKKKKADAQQEVPFDLSRYVPVVKRIVEGHIDGTIDQRLFPNNIRTVKQQNLRKNTAEAVKEVPKLRVYKTQWHKKSTGANAAPKPPSGPPVIIFIVGGMTYSEIRSAYELAETFDREIYIGSTHVITPDKFVQDISQLDKDNSMIDSVIPPYTGSVHDSVKAINNDQKPPPRIASSTNPMPQKSHKLLRKCSMLLPTPVPYQAAWSNVPSFSVDLTVPMLVWVLSRSAAMREPNPVVFLAKLFLLILILRSVWPRVEREGKDVAIVSHTRPVDFVMKVVERLSFAVESIIKSVKKTNHLVSVGNAWAAFGVGSEIAAQVMEKEIEKYRDIDFIFLEKGETFWHLDAPMSRITAAGVPTPYVANLDFPDEHVIVKDVEDNLEKIDF
ncbi:hypothetical protein G6F37_006323 [Rhizopus arrhizus]|nr:hypothetical protein G6F38_009265 [Rhizopus arrhizus]KAG1157867.1 hypothetical protein G6F37_006323 [Rhizopus arrhizus]